MPENVINDEKLLLARIAEGDEQAFHAIYNSYAGKVYGMALHYLKSAFVAQDAAQEVFSKVWLQRTNLPGLDNFDSWLTIVTKNLLINQLRKNIPSAASFEPNPNAWVDAKNPAGYMDYRELEALLNFAVQQLPLRQKEVYELSRHSGLPHQEIARQLGISYHTAREHMSKALKSIRATLEKQYGPLGLILCLLYSI